MNILPKKSWHVRTKKNIERVRRDEAEAAAKEKELQKRAKMAELEASLDILRRNNTQIEITTAPAAGSLDLEDTGQQSSSLGGTSTTTTQDGHLNLFKEVEMAEGKVHGANKEAESEKNKETEDWQKKVGILQYLGQSVNASDGTQRFYDKLERTVDLDKDLGRRQDKEKEALDPLVTMRKYLIVKRGETSVAGTSNGTTKSDQSRRIEFCMEGTSAEAITLECVGGSKRGKRRQRSPSTSSSSDSDERNRRRQAKMRKKKRKSRRRSPSSDSDPSSQEDRARRKRANLDLLRKQRLEREERERKRTQQFLESLAGKDDQLTIRETTAEDTERARRYNSQYNPHLSKW